MIRKSIFHHSLLLGFNPPQITKSPSVPKPPSFQLPKFACPQLPFQRLLRAARNPGGPHWCRPPCPQALMPQAQILFFGAPWPSGGPKPPGLPGPQAPRIPRGHRGSKGPSARFPESLLKNTNALMRVLILNGCNSPHTMLDLCHTSSTPTPPTPNVTHTPSQSCTNIAWKGAWKGARICAWIRAWIFPTYYSTTWEGQEGGPREGAESTGNLSESMHETILKTVL